jgi:hypothetical protein
MKKNLTFKDYVEELKKQKPAGSKTLHDVLRTKKGGAHFDQKHDFSRAKEKQKSRREMYENKKVLDVKTYTPTYIANFHGVSFKHIMDQLKKGIQVEMEHTTNIKVAREIALDHLLEDPNYYTKLAKMENK